MTLKERLAGGECLIGGGMYSNSPDVLEWAAVGLDWIWWDAQHTHADWSALLLGVQTARARGIPVLIRTWTQEGGTLERLLDTGAEGVIVPMVNTAAQAEEIVSHCYYPPAGNRSYGSVHTERVEPSLEAWNRRILTVLQIETPQAVENADAIARVPGVDALHVGMRDLAYRMGKGGDDYSVHTLVSESLAHVAEACRRHGKAAAVIVSSPEELTARIRDGYRLICAGMDVNLVEEGWRRMREAARLELDDPIQKSQRT